VPARGSSGDRHRGVHPSPENEVGAGDFHSLDDLIACTSNDGGMVNPSVLAGPRLIDQLEFCGLLHGQLTRLGTFEDLVDEDGCLSILVGSPHMT
jgi:hypothetical protein